MPKRPSTAHRRAPARGRSREQVELNQRMMALLKHGGDKRSGMIRRVRQSIKADTYVNALKLDVAVERMMEEV